MTHWADKIFYHIYPLGMCGAPKRNDFSSPAGDGLYSLTRHIPRLVSLGINALYIGPLFESTSHGYDTVDYYHVDRRLGNNEALKELVRAFHDNGIAVVLDAVFNHTGRDFFAFKDMQAHKNMSQYAGWYLNVDFSRNNEHNDGFFYEGWAGHTSLVKLNLESRAVRDHLLGAVQYWIEEFDIDGLRLDAANVMSVEFLKELSAFSKNIKNDFWLMGEIVAGDYRRIAHEGCLDSATNYELSKSLWSSFRSQNIFELSWTLKREFAADGLYPSLALYNFADNHDVNRASSSVGNPAYLFPLYGAMFCAPGIPSIYYGSEFGITGERSEYSDYELRPAWNDNWATSGLAKNLFGELCRFAKIRRESEALKYGSYSELFVNYNQTFAFMRESANEQIIVAVNANSVASDCVIEDARIGNTAWKDALCDEDYIAADNVLKLRVQPSWLRILKRKA
ncbi:MAG: alpha-amylase family glycosyl hydrolase [Treponemataceae bacterium]|nr:MAG: alpha-amylase family glycosyl hydrolase [Treponemataceae bacterium]